MKLLILGVQIHLLVCSLSSGGGDGGNEHNRKKTDGVQTLRGQLQVNLVFLSADT